MWLRKLRKQAMKPRFLLKRLLRKVFKRKKSLLVGIYGPPNAGKTTLANRISGDFCGETMGEVTEIPHETRRAVKKEKITMESENGNLSLDIVDMPGLATKIDYLDFIDFGLDEDQAKYRAKEATEGVIDAVRWLDDLDAAILVMDSTEDPYTQVNIIMVGNMEARKIPILILANKIDLPDSYPGRIREAFPQHTIIPISALEGTNMENFYKEIVKCLG